jgi:hypothetical protein
VEKRIEVALHTIRNRRHKYPYFPARDFTIKQEIIEFLRSNCIKVGIDVAGFDSYIEQNKTEVRQQIANLKAEANTQAAALLKVFFNGVDNAVGRISDCKELTPLQILGHADAINSVGPNIHLNTTHAGSFPNDPNSATFVYSVGTEGFTLASDSVGFFFLWQNQNDSTIIVDVAASLSLMGLCESSTAGAIFGDADLKVSAALHIHELWNDPPTSPIFQPAQSLLALETEAQTLGFFFGNDFDIKSVEKSFEPRYSQFVMPPNGVALFEVACELEGNLAKSGPGDDPLVEADFLTFGRRVLCPYVGILPLTF